MSGNLSFDTVNSLEKAKPNRGHCISISRSSHGPHCLAWNCPSLLWRRYSLFHWTDIAMHVRHSGICT